MIKLTITEKGGEPKALSFDKDDVSIGRVSGNDIVLPKGNVSKRHSRLSLRNGQIEIADLKSTNGTYVNGRKIADPMLLTGTDRVFVGDFLITVEGAAAGEGASAARRIPVPPPPPLPGSRTGPGVTRPPDESTSMGEDGDEDEENMPLAAKPPARSPRIPVPPPPPPPPRRPPTPLATDALEEDEGLDDVAPPAPREVDASEDVTGSAGLFERGATADHAAFDGAGGRAPTTGQRPGAALPASEPGSAPVFDRPAAVEAPLEPPPGAAPEPPGGALSGLAGLATLGATSEGLDALWSDAAVIHIVIAGPDAAYADRGQGLALVTPGLGDPNAVADALWRIANAAVPPPPPDNPVVDVRLSDGTRIAAAFPPASPAGVVASIRRPGLRERTLADLVPTGANDLLVLLEAAVAAQRNLLCTGDAAALAALMGALASAIPVERRVVSIGGAPPKPRPGWTDLAGTPDMPALVRVAAALRADHLLATEPAGPEALELLQVAARGQEGLAIALPGRSAPEALSRLEALSLPTLGAAGAAAATALATSTIDLVVHVVTAADGAVRIVEIVEPIADGARLGATAVATWQAEGGRRGGASGRLEVTGVSRRLGAAFAAAGHPLASALVRA
jgi:pilus assembly protein CpaF